jgi:histidinol-phosphate/aromatic aminotransferase/cobyric acid decarboxylase-like protein
MAAMQVSRTVYSLYYPETRRVVDALWAERPHALYERNYGKRQDAMHRGCLDGWVAWATRAGVRLGDGFAHHYPTSGASEGIHALLAFQATHGGGRVHVFEGEYEGYAHTAAALALPVVAHPRARDTWTRAAASLAPGDSFWVSQPSAIDGNLWADFADFAALIAERAPGAGLVVDLTYVGAVPAPLPIDLERAPVAAVLWSLSKPFGVYYHRIGGLLTRVEVPALRGHHWFKNLFSLALGERLMASFAAGELPARYRAEQERALAEARDAGLVAGGARVSDVVILAHAPAGDERFAEYRRGAGLRFCLSPMMDARINPEARLNPEAR